MNTDLRARRDRITWRRFSIQTAMVAIVFAAVVFASYRLGVQHGRSLGPIVPTDASVTHIDSRDYDISDLATSDEDAQLIITSIRNSLDVDNWDVAGVCAELRYDPDRKRLPCRTFGLDASNWYDFSKLFGILLRTAADLKTRSRTQRRILDPSRGELSDATERRSQVKRIGRSTVATG